MSKQSLGPQTCIYPTPVLLVGSYDADGKANVMTAAWGGICNSVPVCVNVSIRKARHTYAAIMARRAFTISLPGKALIEQADFAGMASGRNMDKFAKAGLTAVRSKLVDAPYLDECPVVLELRLYTTLEMPSHTMFVGQVEDVKADQACLTPDGNIDFMLAQTLVYDTSAKCYHIPGNVVGKAYSIGKKLFG